MKPEYVNNTARCKRCGSENVTWQHSPKGKWYLTEVFRNERSELVTDYRDFHSEYCDIPAKHDMEQARRDALVQEEQRERKTAAAKRERIEREERERYFLALVDMTPEERGKRIAEIEQWLRNYKNNPPTMDHMVDFMREQREAEARKTELEFLKALPHQPEIPQAKKPVRKRPVKRTTKKA